MGVLRRMKFALGYAVSILTLVALAAPSALGAAMGPVLRELGSTNEHVCKCGMPAGTCGCPECAREREGTPDPTLRSHCDDDAPAIRLGAPLPTTVAASTSTAALPASSTERVSAPEGTALLPSRDIEPPTPPPRIATV